MNDQSKKAYEKAKHSAKAKREIILKLLDHYGGLTCEETSELINIHPHKISGRFTELKNAGLIRCIGKRETASGCQADVWLPVYRDINLTNEPPLKEEQKELCLA